MYFIQKWNNLVYKSSAKNLIKKSELTTAKEVVDMLYTSEDKTKSAFNIVEERYLHKPTTVLQRLNRIWFTVVFFLIIAPLRFIFIGESKFDERTTFGNLIAKLIGEERVSKAFGYKGGWQKTLDRKEFEALLLENEVVTANDFVKFMFSETELNWEDYLIVKNTSEKNKPSMIQRINLIWVIPLTFLVLLPCKSFLYIKNGSFEIINPDLDVKFKKVMNYLLGW